MIGLSIQKNSLAGLSVHFLSIWIPQHGSDLSNFIFPPSPRGGKELSRRVCFRSFPILITSRTATRRRAIVIRILQKSHM